MAYNTLQGQLLDACWKTIAESDNAKWLSSAEALDLANTLLLLQKDIGGWEKNIQPQKLAEAEKLEYARNKENNVGATIDNGATTTEMLFLAKVYAHQKDARIRIGFLKGLDYLLKAQYESGGWPQFYPLRKGYYAHITFNDDATVNVMKLLKEVADPDTYAYLNIPRRKKEKAQIAFQKGVDCIVNTQYRQNGILTAWCAQHDVNTLLPAKARTYELPSLSGSESAQIVRLLMKIEHPSQKVITAINAAVEWFKKTRIEGLMETRTYNDKGKVIHKKMVQDSTAGPLWARFMELDDNTPFFCDRDGIKKYNLDEIGEERRNGYRWYTDNPEEILKEYPKWKKRIDSQTVELKNVDRYNMEVAKDGTGDFTRIQEAINAAKAFPDKWVTIQVKNGVYYEKVVVHEWNNHVKIVGEDRYKTIITFDDYFDKLAVSRNSTFHTPTLLVQGNDFHISNLTIENSAGEMGQAIALSINANRVKVENCSIKGNQDTVYVTGEGFKQYFKDCYIEGTTDFIFGQATVFFEDCEIHSKSNSFITAASTPKGTNFGLVFQNCMLTAEQGIKAVYLGRPWRTFAKTVFLNCTMGVHVLPKGWDNWNNKEAERMSLYAEYQNKGPGFQPDKRVAWSHQLTKAEAKHYTKSQILRDANNLDWYLKF